MMRGICGLSLVAHPNRLHPRVPSWLFFKNDDYALPSSRISGSKSFPTKKEKKEQEKNRAVEKRGEQVERAKEEEVRF